jgi:hypothetical protein
VLDPGPLPAARGMEAYLLLWVRLLGNQQSPMFNIRIVNARVEAEHAVVVDDLTGERPVVRTGHVVARCVAGEVLCGAGRAVPGLLVDCRRASGTRLIRPGQAHVPDRPRCFRRQ